MPQNCSIIDIHIRRSTKMCDVIPENFQSVPFQLKLNHLGYKPKRSRITSHILIALSQGIML